MGTAILYVTSAFPRFLVIQRACTVSVCQTLFEEIPGPFSFSPQKGLGMIVCKQESGNGSNWETSSPLLLSWSKNTQYTIGQNQKRCEMICIFHVMGRLLVRLVSLN